MVKERPDLQQKKYRYILNQILSGTAEFSQEMNLKPGFVHCYIEKRRASLRAAEHQFNLFRIALQNFAEEERRKQIMSGRTVCVYSSRE